MKIDCPLCGARDLREFTYRGSAKLLDRPPASLGLGAFHDYVHVRENVEGENAELWHHSMGCSAWLHVRRDTKSHAIVNVALARDMKS